jgi:Ricin-type beta-trefoil lectin domain
VDIWTSLDPASAVVEPGASVRVTLGLNNTADLAAEYRIGLVGVPAVWAEVEPNTVRVSPGGTGTVGVTFRPPRGPQAAAGLHRFAIEVTPTERPERKAVVEGDLTIAPFTEIRAELVPPSVRGRLGGNPVLSIDNLGNAPLSTSLAGEETGGGPRVEFRPDHVQVEPGHSVQVRGRVDSRPVKWFGGSQPHPYTVRLMRPEAEPIEVEGTYLQVPLLPSWLRVAGPVLVATVIAAVLGWLLVDPASHSQAGESAITRATHPLLTGQTPAPAEQPPAAPPQQQPTVLFARTLISNASGRCVDVAGGLGADQNPLQIFDCNGSAAQRWSFMSDGTARALGFCMDVVGGNNNNRTPIQIATCNGTQAQHFVVSGAGDLVNVGANKCVDVKDGQTANGTRLQLWSCAGTPNQKWH